MDGWRRWKSLETKIRKSGREEGTQTGSGSEKEEIWGDSSTEKEGSLSILVSHSARREVTVFQGCLHSLPVGWEHPEDTVGTQKCTLMSNHRKCHTDRRVFNPLSPPSSQLLILIEDILWESSVAAAAANGKRDRRKKGENATTDCRENYRLKDKNETENALKVG